jgi:hAT family C-terminal dimerisation region
MKGELNGLQALFLKECPYAYYVHCYAHRLQLVLVAASKDVVPVWQFFEKLNYITNVVDNSAKRHDELHNAQVVELARMLAIDEIETGKGANQICTLKRPGDTRWGTHLSSISNLMKMFNAVRSVLHNIGADASASSVRAEADVAFNHLVDFEFVFVLCMMKEVLEIAEILSQALQKKSQDLVNAVHLVSSTRVLLQKMRENGWEIFFGKLVKFCESHGINVPNMDETYILRGGRARRQPDHFIKERYFRVEIFLVTIDTQLQELNYRFNEKVMDLLSLSATLVPKNNFRSFNVGDICCMVEKYYPRDFTQQERYGLEQQLHHFTVDISSCDDLKKIPTLTELCRCLVETNKHTIYNFVDRLIRLLVTLPVSTASAERAFSALKIIKTRLRNKMEDEFLANSLLVYIEDEIAESYNYDDIILDFKKLKKGRADL